MTGTVTMRQDGTIILPQPDDAMSADG